MAIKSKCFVLISLIILLVITISVLCLTNNPYIRNRLYFGDRIKGDVAVTLYGSNLPLVRYLPMNYQRNNDKFKTTKSVDHGDRVYHFSIKGDSYGAYYINFDLINEKLIDMTDGPSQPSIPVEGKTTKVSFAFVKSNWAIVVYLSVRVDLVYENGKWLAKITLSRKYTDDENKKINDTIHETVNLSNGEAIDIFEGL